MQIDLERTGRIMTGSYEGYFVRIHHDEEQTGGFYVYVLDNLDSPTDGGDFWFDSVDEVERFFTSSCWVVSWLDRGYPWRTVQTGQ